MNALVPGDQVTHARLGTGVIKSEWGQWLCCGECFGELAVKTGIIDHRHPTKLSNGLMKCPHCRREIGWGRTVSGRGVFDVQFASGVHSINGCWLKSETNLPSVPVLADSVASQPLGKLEGATLNTREAQESTGKEPFNSVNSCGAGQTLSRLEVAA